ncbi:hypothetical protein RRG08_054818 [Elysia crispata]|uniref:Uncharacterized protein n=1 Tax=Elysia crispata TaxID=231223 RepID=A0AAE0YGJ9_9GAST|nr:hypothetical protein RRG08_054818 [Elysia crispata]
MFVTLCAGDSRVRVVANRVEAKHFNKASGLSPETCVYHTAVRHTTHKGIYNLRRTSYFYKLSKSSDGAKAHQHAAPNRIEVKQQGTRRHLTGFATIRAPEDRP